MVFELYENGFGGFNKYYVTGTKKDLYAFIGYRYSNSLESIDRISYKDIDEHLYERIKEQIKDIHPDCLKSFINSFTISISFTFLIISFIINTPL